MGKLRYYILFENYEQGMAMHELLSSQAIRNRIAPAPRVLQGNLSCGMSLMIEEEQIEAVRNCIDRFHPSYHSIASLEGQICSHRDRYC